MPRALAVGWLACLAVGSATAQSASYTRSADLRPVRLSYTDFAAIAAKASTLIHSANASVAIERTAEGATVSDNRTTVSVSSHFEATSFASGPPVATEASYSYRADQTAPVYLVEIELSDFQRRVRVQGTSEAQVDALARSLLADLRNHQWYFGGSMFRTILGALLLSSAAFMPSLFSKGGKVPLWVAVLAIALALCVFALPWKNWLPGTAVFAGDASLLLRYGPEVSFMGLVLGVVSLALSLRQIRHRRPRSPDGA